MLRLLERFKRGCSGLYVRPFYRLVSRRNVRHAERHESATLAARVLGEPGVPPPKIDLMRRLILATKRYEADGNLLGFGLGLDADLSILGPQEETYLAYSEAIRREYALVPEITYREACWRCSLIFCGGSGSITPNRWPAIRRSGQKQFVERGKSAIFLKGLYSIGREDVRPGSRGLR